jgi:AbrB family looped-hinge helix DNA binding protein
MAKITSKLQLTIPKRLAEQFGLAPGDEVTLEPAGNHIRLIPPGRSLTAPKISRAERLRLFDEDTAWQREREQHMRLPKEAPKDRGWRREDLYVRGKPD